MAGKVQNLGAGHAKRFSAAVLCHVEDKRLITCPVGEGV